VLRSVIYCVGIALAMSTLSCSRRGENIYPVSGKVTYKGAPAAGATVFFTRKAADYAKEHLVMGIVKDDGAFELVCGPLGKGAPPGDYDVAVEWKASAGQKNGNPQRGPDKFNGRYADARHPLLHATVEAKTNDLPPFDLSD
jgi:hypothetical protein